MIAKYNRDRAASLASQAGIREDFMITVDIDQVNLSRPADMAVFLYNLMPPLIMFVIFLAGVHISVDMTAGERERGSLEPLLITPIERSGLLLGKATVGLLMTMLTMVMNLVGFRLLLGLAVGLQGDMTPPPSFASFAMIFVVAIPLMVIAVSTQVAIALISRSMKEAQIYLGLLPLIPALPGMVLVFSPLQPTDAVAAVPLLGQLTLFNQLVAGESIAAMHLLASVTVSLAFAAGIFWFAKTRFEKERLLFAT
ncbi:MAG: ABC transporter permease subunit [Alphaproteobacteria bacterium]